MKEEDYTKEFNTQNRDVQLLQRMLEGWNSLQIEITMKDCKDEREASRTSEEQGTRNYMVEVTNTDLNIQWTTTTT